MNVNETITTQSLNVPNVKDTLQNGVKMTELTKKDVEKKLTDEEYVFLVMQTCNQELCAKFEKKITR